MTHVFPWIKMIPPHLETVGYQVRGGWVDSKKKNNNEKRSWVFGIDLYCLGKIFIVLLISYVSQNGQEKSFIHLPSSASRRGWMFSHRFTKSAFFNFWKVQDQPWFILFFSQSFGTFRNGHVKGSKYVSKVLSSPVSCQSSLKSDGLGKITLTLGLGPFKSKLRCQEMAF